MTPERARCLAAERERERESMAEHLALAGAVAQRANRPIEEQARHLAADLVARLGFEHAAIGMLANTQGVRIVGSFSQSERFADEAAGGPVDLLALLQDAITRTGLVLWAPPGPGHRIRPPRRAGVDYAAGIPLRHDGALIGALVTTDIVPRRWSPADQRALENLAAIAGAVLGASAAAAVRADGLPPVSVKRISPRFAQIDSLHPASSGAYCVASAHADTPRPATAEPDLAALARSDHDAFFGLVSHELRTPLAAVMGHLEMLDDNCASMSDDQRHLLARATDQSRHLCRLVEDLLFLGDAGGGRVDLAWQETPLEPLLARVVGALPRAQRKGARDAPFRSVKIPVHGGPTAIHTDARLLERALFHLAADLADQATSALVVETRVEGTELVVGMASATAAHQPVSRRAQRPDLLSNRFRTAIVRACLSLLGGRLQISGPAEAPRVEIRIPNAVEDRQPAPSGSGCDDRHRARRDRVLGSTRLDSAGARRLRPRQQSGARQGQTVR